MIVIVESGQKYYNINKLQDPEDLTLKICEDLLVLKTTGQLIKK